MQYAPNIHTVCFFERTILDIAQYKPRTTHKLSLLKNAEILNFIQPASLQNIKKKIIKHLPVQWNLG